MVAVGRLVPQLDRLPQRDINVVLGHSDRSRVVELDRVPPGLLSSERAVWDQGDRSIVDPEGRVERGREMPATSTASAEAANAFPCRKVTRSGLLVMAPYRAACRLIDWPPTPALDMSVLGFGIGGVAPPGSGAAVTSVPPGWTCARRTVASEMGAATCLLAVGHPRRGGGIEGLDWVD